MQSSDGRVMYSFNIRDYSLLHEQWIASGAGRPSGGQRGSALSQHITRSPACPPRFDWGISPTP